MNEKILKYNEILMLKLSMYIFYFKCNFLISFKIIVFIVNKSLTN